jgi:hypothetical protein
LQADRVTQDAAKGPALTVQGLPNATLHLPWWGEPVTTTSSSLVGVIVEAVYLHSGLKKSVNDSYLDIGLKKSVNDSTTPP